MEKLLELLREYSTLIWERTGEYWNPIRWWNEKYLTYPIEIMRIKSKEYWFIERLVKNEKIKWRDKTELYYNISCYDWDWWEYELIWPDFTDTEHIIMILSIQDNPIEYLCSILK